MQGSILIFIPRIYSGTMIQQCLILPKKKELIHESKPFGKKLLKPQAQHWYSRAPGIMGPVVMIVSQCGLRLFYIQFEVDTVTCKLHLIADFILFQ